MTRQRLRTGRLGMLTVALLAAAVLPAAAQNAAHRTRLRNGMVVITKEMHSSQVLAVDLFVRGGSSADPADLPGLANFTQRMLLRGTQRRTAEQVSGPIEAIGGTLQARAEHDYSQVLMLSSANALETDLDLLADIVRNPRFDPAEVEKERKQLLTEMSVLDQQPAWLVQNDLGRMVYATGPYRYPPLGTADAIRRISQADLVGFHRRVFTPENMILVLVGNIDRAAAEESVMRLFGDMPASGRPPLAVQASTTSALGDRGGNVAVRERPAQVAHLAIAFPIAGVSREDYPAIMVLNSLLGGGMGSRLMQQVREKQSLGYDVGTYYTQEMGPSCLVAYLKTEPVRYTMGADGFYATSEMILNKAKNAVLEQFETLKEHPPTDAEMERARRYTIGTFIYEHQRTLNQARYLGWFELAGLGYNFDEDLPLAVAHVTKQDLMNLANKYFTRYAVAIVMPEPRSGQ